MKNIFRGLLLAVSQAAVAVMLMVACPPGGEIEACTSFALRTPRGVLLGHSYDFPIGNGLLIVNKRNVEKLALVNDNRYWPRAARWISRYGSLTFNQFGRELPQGGMNERGLVVEQMANQDGRMGNTADKSNRPLITELQWIQYQLDNFERVAGVIAHAGELQMNTTAVPLHYLVCDAQGECAILEFSNDELQIYTGKDLNPRALTNSSYPKSRQHYEKVRRLPFSRLPAGTDSLDRFDRAAALTESFDRNAGADGIDYAFRVLDAVRVRPTFFHKVVSFFGGFVGLSQWNAVYNPTKHTLQFRTLAAPNRRLVHLDLFDFSCRSPVLALDVNSPGEGSMGKYFQIYDREMNRKVISRSYGMLNKISDGKFPKEIINFLVDYPDRFPCREAK